MTDQFPYIRVVGACRKLGPTVLRQHSNGVNQAFYCSKNWTVSGVATNAALTLAPEMQSDEFQRLRSSISSKIMRWLDERLAAELEQLEASR